MVDEVAERFGHIDILVNSAGVFLPGVLGALSPEQASYRWAVNVHGVVATTQQALSHMPDGGRIINLGSIAGERAFGAGFDDYSATKSAVMAYSRSWAHELGATQHHVEHRRRGLRPDRYGHPSRQRHGPNDSWSNPIPALRRS
jgi:NAD(P)-dependent dehydrogenase (short-subunit alcohol dehydrogenase family)